MGEENNHISSSKILSVLTGILGLGVGYMLGSFFGLNFDISEGASQSGYTGIYHTDNFNNKEDTLILNEDGTCKYPGARSELEANQCTYTIRDDKLYINGSNSSSGTITSRGIMYFDRIFMEKM